MLQLNRFIIDEIEYGKMFVAKEKRKSNDIQRNPIGGI